MVEQGFVEYVQNGLADLAPAVSVPGGFNVQLPPQQISATSPQAWSYRSITNSFGYTLAGWSGWTEWHVQIDCHGQDAAQAQALAHAIDQVLRGGFQGNFPDPDATHVYGIYRLPTQVDLYSDANRSFVRTIEYAIQYEQV